MFNNHFTSHAVFKRQALCLVTFDVFVAVSTAPQPTALAPVFQWHRQTP